MSQLKELALSVADIANDMFSSFPDSVDTEDVLVLSNFCSAKTEEEIVSLGNALLSILFYLFDKFPYAELENDDEVLFKFKRLIN